MSKTHPAVRMRCNNSCKSTENSSYFCKKCQYLSNTYRLQSVLEFGEDIIVRCIFPGQVSWHDGNSCHSVITALRKHSDEKVKICYLYYYDYYQKYITFIIFLDKSYAALLY